jgi:hypothetical protein
MLNRDIKTAKLVMYHSLLFQTRKVSSRIKQKKATRLAQAELLVNAIVNQNIMIPISSISWVFQLIKANTNRIAVVAYDCSDC